MKTVYVRNAFHGFKGRYKATFNGYGQICVWDDVAGHYTTCHSLTPNQIRYAISRLRALEYRETR
jgi:hypothetical protein